MKTLFLLLALLFSSCTNSSRPKNVLSGVIRIKAGMESRISPTAVLYLIARRAEASGAAAKTPAGGPPLAVKRYVQPLQFPIHFQMGKDDLMMGGAAGGEKLEGAFQLSARIAQSGSATPAKRGDLEGFATEPAIPGEKEVSVEINETRR